MTRRPRAPAFASTLTNSRRGALGRSIALVLIVSIAALGTAPAHGADIASGIEHIGVRLDDAQLANMRGKFVRPEGISYFGIMMTTSWQGSDGITTHANLLLKVDFVGGPGGLAAPQLLVGWTRDGDPALDLGKFGPAAQAGYLVAASGSSDPLAAAGSGAIQTTVIAGADNHAFNGLSIAVVPRASIGDQPSPGLSPITSGQSTQFSNGDQLRFDVQPGAVGVLVGNGDNNAHQRIDSTLGLAAQAINIVGDHMSGSNLMLITIGTDSSAAFHTFQADQALAAHVMTGF